MSGRNPRSREATRREARRRQLTERQRLAQQRRRRRREPQRSAADIKAELRQDVASDVDAPLDPEEDIQISRDGDSFTASLTAAAKDKLATDTLDEVQSELRRTPIEVFQTDADALDLLQGQFASKIKTSEGRLEISEALEKSGFPESKTPVYDFETFLRNVDEDALEKVQDRTGPLDGIQETYIEPGKRELRQQRQQLQDDPSAFLDEFESAGVKSIDQAIEIGRERLSIRRDLEAQAEEDIAAANPGVEPSDVDAELDRGAFADGETDFETSISDDGRRAAATQQIIRGTQFERDDIAGVRETEDGFQPELTEDAQAAVVADQTDLSRDEIADVRESDDGFVAELTGDAERERRIDALVEQTGLDADDIAGVRETEDGVRPVLTDDAEEQRQIDALVEQTGLDADDIAGVRETEDGVRPVLTEDAQEQRQIDALVEQTALDADDIAGVRETEEGIRPVLSEDAQQQRQQQAVATALANQFTTGVGGTAFPSVAGTSVSADAPSDEEIEQQIAQESNLDAEDVEVNQGEVLERVTAVNVLDEETFSDLTVTDVQRQEGGGFALTERAAEAERRTVNELVGADEPIEAPDISGSVNARGQTTVAPGVGSGGDGNDVVQFLSGVEDRVAEIPGASQAADVVAFNARAGADVAGGVADLASPVTDPIVNLSEEGQERLIEGSIEPSFDAIDVPDPVADAADTVPGVDEAGRGSAIFLENLASETARFTVGAPAQAAAALGTAEAATDFTAEQIQERGVVEGSARTAEVGGDIAGFAARRGVQAFRDDPLGTTAALGGTVAGGFAAGGALSATARTTASATRSVSRPDLDLSPRQQARLDSLRPRAGGSTRVRPDSETTVIDGQEVPTTSAIERARQQEAAGPAGGQVEESAADVLDALEERFDDAEGVEPSRPSRTEAVDETVTETVTRSGDPPLQDEIADAGSVRSFIRGEDLPGDRPIRAEETSAFRELLSDESAQASLVGRQRSRPAVDSDQQPEVFEDFANRRRSEEQQRSRALQSDVDTSRSRRRGGRGRDSDPVDEIVDRVDEAAERRVLRDDRPVFGPEDTTVSATDSEVREAAGAALAADTVLDGELQSTATTPSVFEGTGVDIGQDTGITARADTDVTPRTDTDTRARTGLRERTATAPQQDTGLVFDTPSAGSPSRPTGGDPPSFGPTGIDLTGSDEPPTSTTRVPTPDFPDLDGEEPDGTGGTVFSTSDTFSSGIASAEDILDDSDDSLF